MDDDDDDVAKVEARIKLAANKRIFARKIDIPISRASIMVLRRNKL